MFSLIVSTLGRVAEVERLLASLDSQTCKDFEVILVDQNPDDRLLAILQRHPGLLIRHLHSARGISRGRNVALPLANGDLICFPDDDCWYPHDLLAVVEAWFAGRPQFGALFACLRDAENNLVGPNWPREAGVCTPEDVVNHGSSTCGFLRRQVTDAIGFFDENLGLGAGSQYQAGEDPDYYLRALEHGFCAWFDPSITVHHPNLHSPERLRRRTYPYALAAGYVMRTHGFSGLSLTRRLLRSLGGAAVSLLKTDLDNTKVYLWRAAGQFRGYFWGPRDMARPDRRAS